MTVANAIIRGNHAAVERLLANGEGHVDDLDEYGFTPLIESVIAKDKVMIQYLLEKGATIDKSDISGRSPLHWAAHLNDDVLCRLLLEQGANVNSYTRAGQAALVYPLLRDQKKIKQLFYDHGADLNFAQDFINAKLIGHRFQLTGDVDIVNSADEFVELDYEGFYLEFTINIIYHSLSQFRNHYAARRFRAYLPYLDQIRRAFRVASELVNYQQYPEKLGQFTTRINLLLGEKLLLLPIAYQGHAITFIKYGCYLAKCDRGENSDKEGSVNIYKVNNLAAFNKKFLRDLLYTQHHKNHIHQQINQYLGLTPCFSIPLPRQVAGNCSWANVEAALPTAYFLLLIANRKCSDIKDSSDTMSAKVLNFYAYWKEWDKDRALTNCIQQFRRANTIRKASLAAILGGVLFQSCDYSRIEDIGRAEKILTILNHPDYHYVLKSYLDIYCTRRLTKKGNNLLNILDDCGVEMPRHLYFRPTEED